MPDIESVEAQIINGGRDVNTPQANATAFVNSQVGSLVGTGTLIAPDVVLSAGHVFATHSTPPPGSRGRGGLCDWEVPGQWYSFPNHWATQNPTVRFGPDENNPTLTETVIAYAIPDCADVIALLLQNPVDRTVATPAPVVTRPMDLGDIVAVDVAGYGNTTQTGSDARFRQIATINGPFVANFGSREHIEADDKPAGIGLGDSGGPVYLANTNRLIGIIRQSRVGNDSIWTATWVEPVTSGDPRMPRVAPFLSRISDCATLRNQAQPLPDSPPPEDVVPIFNWWHRGRGDNFLTSDPRWSDDVTRLTFSNQHLVNGPRREGYTMYRFDAYLWDPKEPQPAGTVPLFSWWNRDRGDNFSSSDPRWSIDPGDVRWRGNHITNGTQREGYSIYRLEGFLYDPKRPQPPGTVPLFSWWNRDRGDNFTTTDPRYGMNLGSIQWRGEHISNGPTRGGYTLYRLEGFAVDRRTVDGYRTDPIPR